YRLDLELVLGNAECFRSDPAGDLRGLGIPAAADGGQDDAERHREQGHDHGHARQFKTIFPICSDCASRRAASAACDSGKTWSTIGLTFSRATRRSMARNSSLPLVTETSAPSACARSIATVATPPPIPVTSTCSPFCSWPRVTSAR